MKSNKKAFTIVELVIVIAVIAILAAVLIPTFSNMIKRSKVSADQQLIRNLNSALKADLKDHNTMTDALAAAAEFGYDVSKINKSATDNEILWDSKNDAFCYFESDKNQITYIPGTDKTVDSVDAVDYWIIAKTPSDKYSTYLYGYEGNGKLTITKGLDVGNETSVTEVAYVRTTGASQDVTIRTNGGTLVVNAPSDNVYHYGNADSVNIIAVASTSYHENGTVPFIQISKGRIEIEATADVNGIHIANVQTMDANFSITRNTEEFSHDVTVTLNGKEVKLSRDKIGTNLSSAVLVCKVEATAGASEYIWLFGNGTIEDAKVYVTNSTTAPDTTEDSDVNLTNASKAAIAIANNATNTGTEQAPVWTASDSGKTAEEAEAASALKGSGTQEDPFLIYDYATMQKISDFYDKGYYYFEVALDKTDNGKIDCENWEPVKLNGSFDGKGVVFTQLDMGLFDCVDGESSVIKDFTIYANISRSAGVGAVVYDSNTLNLTIDSVDVHGTIIGATWVTPYVEFGPGPSYAWNLTIKNSVSDATLVATSGVASGFVGHPYDDVSNGSVNGKSLITIIDSAYIGNMSATGALTSSNFKYFTINGNDNRVKTLYSDAFIAKLGFNPEGTLYAHPTDKTDYQVIVGEDNSKTFFCGNYGKNVVDNYIKEFSKASLNTTAKAALPSNIGDTFTITKVPGASKAVVSLLIAPNDSNNYGSYLGTYMSEDIDITAVEANSTFKSESVRYFTININSSVTDKTGVSGNIFNVVNPHYGVNAHNGATVKIVQFDTNGNVLNITSIQIAAPHVAE